MLGNFTNFCLHSLYTLFVHFPWACPGPLTTHNGHKETVQSTTNSVLTTACEFARVHCPLSGARVGHINSNEKQHDGPQQQNTTIQPVHCWWPSSVKAENKYYPKLTEPCNIARRDHQQLRALIARDMTTRGCKPTATTTTTIVDFSCSFPVARRYLSCALLWDLCVVHRVEPGQFLVSISRGAPVL